MDYSQLKGSLADFDDSSRIWVYQSDRSFSDEECTSIQKVLDRFTVQWVAHNQSLKSKALILNNRFIVLLVDESQAGASGCSIDASVHFLKQLQSEYGMDLFNRMNFAYVKDDLLEFVSKDEFSKRYQSGVITDETPVVDTLVKNKSALLKEWIKPLNQSWHRRMV